jgi:L-fuculose-phosphate aldolase
MTALRELRAEVVAVMRILQHAGLNYGAAGNVSTRVDDGFLVTPTGVPPDELEPDQIVLLDYAGEAPHEQRWRPSSEWRFHRDIYVARPEINAVVHVHSTYATALSCTRRDMPAFHYMICTAGGDSVRCAPYALFGTQALSDVAVAALEGRRACLLANHGMIAIGSTLPAALRLTTEIEELARQYCITLQIGGPKILDDAEMSEVLERFKTYGQQPR